MLAVALLACSDPPTAPGAGTLSVTIEGLPPGGQPEIAVTGPESHNLVVGLSGAVFTSTLASVASGTYRIDASSVTSGGVRYDPAPANQTVVVSRDAIAASRIVYSAATARLAITVVGLPAGASAGVLVTGPGGFSHTFAASTQLDFLAPGVYTVTAPELSSGGKVYRAVPATQLVALVAGGALATAAVEYGSGDAALDVTIAGLPDAAVAAVTVTGPDGSSRLVTSSGTLHLLEAGTYTVTAGVTGSSLTTHRPITATQTIGIAAGATNAVTVTYGSEPLQLALQQVADGLTQPVFLTAPDGDARLFIVERIGRVRVVVNGVLAAAPFLDIRDRVNNVGERGLLSIAFDPHYATNGYLYAYYVDFGGNVVVERFGSTPGASVAGGSAGMVISIPHGGSEHHGGLVAFGPDGMMYLAPGDGGCCGDPTNQAQNTATLLGKLLRIDARTLPYQIPVDNPFASGDGARPEIWALGLRSPWRFSFDPQTGALHLADVGEDSREEVNAVRANAAGLNYGWRRMEGLGCFIPATDCDPAGSFTLPVLQYPHSDGCSVIGGFVYRGMAIPELTGHYLYADFCRGWLRSFLSSPGSAAERQSWAGVSLPFTTSFGRDAAGELYMTSGTRVWRIVRQ
jgi:glucose/arabinose dehydrogenase